MVTPQINELSQAITWDFRLAAQGMMTRYGHIGSTYYKQFLPAGLEVPGKHPPKKIDPKLYSLARARYNNSSKS